MYDVEDQSWNERAYSAPEITWRHMTSAIFALLLNFSPYDATLFGERDERQRYNSVEKPTLKSLHEIDLYCPLHKAFRTSVSFSLISPFVALLFLFI